MKKYDRNDSPGKLNLVIDNRSSMKVQEAFFNGEVEVSPKILWFNKTTEITYSIIKIRKITTYLIWVNVIEDIDNW